MTLWEAGVTHPCDTTPITPLQNETLSMPLSTFLPWGLGLDHSE